MAHKRKFTVGQRVWRFNENRREYTKPASGRTWGELIYASHFEERKIKAINKRRYAIAWADGDFMEWMSFAKAESLFSTDAEKADKVYRHDHAYNISERVRTAHPDTLRQIAKLIGYNDGEGSKAK